MVKGKIRKSIDEILEMIQMASEIGIIRSIRVKGGKFRPKRVENKYGRKMVAIGYQAKSNTYLILDNAGWLLSDKNSVNYFEEYNVDEQFKGIRVWVEKLSYEKEEE